VVERGTGLCAQVDLKMPGKHNVSNALAAIAASCAAGVEFHTAAKALKGFSGVRRRLEFVGEKAGVTVIDDFGHNPDKISASLNTLHEFPGRLLVMFQPHGFGPLKKMQTEFVACFVENLHPDDMLIMPEPVYYGGTTDKSVSSGDIVAGVLIAGRRALAFPTRSECGDYLIREARSGDRVVIMGARDDTLSEFAIDLLSRLG